jgi:predicted Fe-S protein YdhL (DUF1289 family)
LRAILRRGLKKPLVQSSILSPCIRVCKLRNDSCIGCLRTIEEIRNWSIMNDEEKLRCWSRISLEPTNST